MNVSFNKLSNDEIYQLEEGEEIEEIEEIKEIKEETNEIHETSYFKKNVLHSDDIENNGRKRHMNLFSTSFYSTDDTLVKKSRISSMNRENNIDNIYLYNNNNRINRISLLETPYQSVYSNIYLNFNYWLLKAKENKSFHPLYPNELQQIILSFINNTNSESQLLYLCPSNISNNKNNKKKDNKVFIIYCTNIDPIILDNMINENINIDNNNFNDPIDDKNMKDTKNLFLSTFSSIPCRLARTTISNNINNNIDLYNKSTNLIYQFPFHVQNDNFREINITDLFFNYQLNFTACKKNTSELRNKDNRKFNPYQEILIFHPSLYFCSKSNETFGKWEFKDNRLMLEWLNDKYIVIKKDVLYLHEGSSYVFSKNANTIDAYTVLHRNSNVHNNNNDALDYALELKSAIKLTKEQIQDFINKIQKNQSEQSNYDESIGKEKTQSYSIEYYLLSPNELKKYDYPLDEKTENLELKKRTKIMYEINQSRNKGFKYRNLKTKNSFHYDTYIDSSKFKHTKESKKHDIIVLDCEMCETVFENEITRVAAIRNPQSSKEQNKKEMTQDEIHVVNTNDSRPESPCVNDDGDLECDVVSVCASKIPSSKSVATDTKYTLANLLSDMEDKNEDNSIYDTNMKKIDRSEEEPNVSMFSSFENNAIYDRLILPKNKIIDFLTPYSGITYDLLFKETSNIPVVDLKSVHSDWFSDQTCIDENTILVGHSLNNDLRCLRLIHNKVIDTSILYPHPKGYPYKTKLKDLVEKYELNHTNFDFDQLYRLLYDGSLPENSNGEISDNNYKADHCSENPEMANIPNKSVVLDEKEIKTPFSEEHESSSIMPMPNSTDIVDKLSPMSKDVEEGKTFQEGGHCPLQDAKMSLLLLLLKLRNGPYFGIPFDNSNNIITMLRNNRLFETFDQQIEQKICFYFVDNNNSVKEQKIWEKFSYNFLNLEESSENDIKKKNLNYTTTRSLDELYKKLELNRIDEKRNEDETENNVVWIEIPEIDNDIIKEENRMNLYLDHAKKSSTTKNIKSSYIKKQKNSIRQIDKFMHNIYDNIAPENSTFIIIPQLDAGTLTLLKRKHLATKWKVGNSHPSTVKLQDNPDFILESIEQYRSSTNNSFMLMKKKI